MAKRQSKPPEWREFERLVARIEADAGSECLAVKSPDRLRCKLTGRLREVDASVRSKVGTAEVLITLECRKRRPKQDVTWVEQLATKKQNLGAARTIAVSSSGFSAEAEVVARHHGIDLRRLTDVSVAEINRMMRIDFVLFPHKRVELARVGFRWYRPFEWKIPAEGSADYSLPPGTDPHAKLFSSMDSKASWSVNDLWLQLQAATNPFEGVVAGEPPIIRTACFPYPGTVTVSTPAGVQTLGDVLLTVALSFEVEQVDFASAKKIEYSSEAGNVLQRVEFASQRPKMEDWRVSLQFPKGSTDIAQLRSRLTRPGDELK